MKFRVLVELNPETGELHVEGPWNDGVLFLGLLEMGKVAFIEGHSQGSGKTKTENKIVVPQLVAGPSRRM